MSPSLWKIVLHELKKYREQPFFRYCGIIQIITILESRLDIQLSHKDIFSWFSKFTWFCAPYQIYKKLQQRWLHASIFAKTHATIDNIKNMIYRNKNVILLTGHWYTKTWRSFNPLKAFFSQHYISIWWYDEEKRGFYVYDSTIRYAEAWTASALPIGNLFLPEHIVQRALSWGGRWLLDDIMIVV